MVEQLCNNREGGGVIHIKVWVKLERVREGGGGLRGINMERETVISYPIFDATCDIFPVVIEHRVESEKDSPWYKLSKSIEQIQLSQTVRKRRRF